jgi:hypothetical protein
MKKCSDVRQNFDAVLFEELAAEKLESFHQHLRTCAECKKKYAAFRQVTDVMKKYRRENASSEFLHSLWSKIETEIATETIRKSTFFNKLKDLVNLEVWWIRYAVAVSLVITGIFIGRFLLTTPKKNDVISQQETGKNAVIQAKTQRYLERSKVLLLGILNHESNTQSDFSRQRELSGNLIREAAILKEELKDSKELLLGALIDDLEKILLQIAHLEKSYDLEAVEMIQSGIRREGILFKINLEEIYQSTQPDQPKNQKSSGSS